MIQYPDYTVEGWARLREVAPDVVMTFDELRQKVERQARRWAEQGVEVTWIVFDRNAVDKMIAWCAGEGRPVDSAARATYGALLAVTLGESGGTA